MKKRAKKQIKRVFFWLFIILILWVFWVLMLHFGLKRAEILECKKWLKERETIKRYYLTNWQIEQCKTLEVFPPKGQK